MPTFILARRSLAPAIRNRSTSSLSSCSDRRRKSRSISISTIFFLTLVVYTWWDKSSLPPSICHWFQQLNMAQWYSPSMECFRQIHGRRRRRVDRLRIHPAYNETHYCRNECNTRMQVNGQSANKRSKQSEYGNLLLRAKKRPLWCRMSGDWLDFDCWVVALGAAT